jgi:23S rRNA pseudouridine1911/1915/1917 synthase
MSFVVTDEAAGSRLDRVLANLVPGISRSRLQALIKGGAVICAGATIGDPGRRVKPGEHYRMIVPEPEPAKPLPEAIPLAVVSEDEHIIVVDKPAGLVVHPAAGHESGTLVNALIAHCGDSLSGIGGVKRPGIVHRLDKDTSGLLVVAKTDQAHQALSAQFQAHGADGRMERRYLALVWGHPLRQRGVIDAPLARSRTSRTKIAVTHGIAGRNAVTHFEVLERFVDSDGKPLASLLQLTLETGRTHQIRVHMAHSGHPVMGDPVYASGFRTSASRLAARSRATLQRLDRQALHAAFLRVEHPVTGKPVAFESPLPPDIANLLKNLRCEHRQGAHALSRKRRI